ncbi:MAG: hypothetical protein WAL41_22100, partial [Mycobacterium sp.]
TIGVGVGDSGDAETLADQLWRIVNSFRMSKHDLQARPVYRHTLESIEAHPSTFFAALVVSHWLEHQTGWSIKQFVLTERRHRTAQIKAGRQALIAADPQPNELRTPARDSATAYGGQPEWRE